MKLADFNRLKKFMALASSTIDAEALAALRQANTLLEREGLIWQRVLDRSVKVIASVEAAPEDYSDPIATPTSRPVRDADYDVRQLDDWIDVIERRSDLRGDFEDLVNDIIAQHRNGKRLSEKQRGVLSKAANR